jgi:pimeloyl-ACP methyl ester carboxylesterase
MRPKESSKRRFTKGTGSCLEPAKPRVAFAFSLGLQVARVCIVLSLAVSVSQAAGGNRWEDFPEPSKTWRKTVQIKKEGCARINDIEMYYAVFGEGDPVLLIHGGLGNADIWEAQVTALSARYQVIVADSRGHGRSTLVSGQQLHYRDMADDYVALLTSLGIEKAALVGWSDGAIIALDIAMRYPEKLSKLFAHAANSDPRGLSLSPGAAWSGYARWAQDDYRRLSGERCGQSRRGNYDSLKAALRPMWRREPNWTGSDLKRIKVPTAIVLGDRDEAIRCDHTKRLASVIPDAKLIILPRVGHFAMRQDPASYNQAIMSFLEGTPPPKLSDCR